jgi:hypothetical protein
VRIEIAAQFEMGVLLVGVFPGQLGQQAEALVAVLLDERGVFGLDIEAFLLGGLGREAVGRLQRLVPARPVHELVAGARKVEPGDGEARVEGDGPLQRPPRVLREKAFELIAAAEEILVGLEGRGRHVGDPGLGLLDLERREPYAARDRPADLVDLRLEDARRAVAPRLGRLEGLARRGIEDLDVGDERLARLGVEADGQGLDPLAPADREGLVLVEDGRGVLAVPPQEVPELLPGRHPEVAGLLEARDEQVGDCFLKVVERRVTCLVPEPDDGDRPAVGGALRNELPGRKGEGEDEPGEGRDPDLLRRQPDRDRFRRRRPPQGQWRGGRRQGVFDLRQPACEVDGAGRPLLGRLVEAPQDEAGQLLRDLRVEGPRVRRGFAFLLDRDAEQGVPFEGQPSRQHLEENDPEGVEVRARSRLLALHLLGRHVLGRADEDVGAGDALALDGPGDAEVHDPGVAVPVDHDVLRLEVAVDDADPVGFLEAFADLAGDAHGLAHGQGADAVNEALEVFPGHVLHGDEVGLALAAEVVHPADVPVRDRSGQPQLAAEAFDRPFVGRDLGVEQLEGQLFADLGVVDLVDAAHAALAQVLDDLVAAGEGLAGGKLARERGRHDRGRGLAGAGHLRAAAAAEAGLRRIFGVAAGTTHRHQHESPRSISPWARRVNARY